MALSRREFQLLVERVGKLEARMRAIEETIKAHESRLKPSNLLRTIRSQEEEERIKKESDFPISGFPPGI